MQHMLNRRCLHKQHRSLPDGNKAFSVVRGCHASRTGGIDSGAGGGPGQAGENGDAGGFYGSGGSGGDAGKYLDGNSNTTFTANGTRTGAVA